MNQPTSNERKSISSWPSQDVDALYEKITKVGSGTYGEVNKARLRSNPSEFVALKKIKDQSETQGFPITALREISILQQCDHPNIVRLLNVASSNLPDPDCKKKKKRGQTFLVFEYMEHELLGLVQSHHFTDAQVKCIMIQILKGLDYIHSRNIIHRDIKSANILMNNKGEVKIADFGLARKFSQGFNGKLTQRVVTRWYRAPELLLGSKKYTTQIDLWALGCVFAELLMGKTHALFPAQKTPDQFAMICEKCGVPSESDWPGHKNLPFYSTMVPKKSFGKVLREYMQKQNKNINPRALDLLDRMLTFNPDKRITTQQALAHPYFHTSPAPCTVEEMPKFDKECHAYMLNLKRKAKMNQKITTIEDNLPVNKITIPPQNIPQPNISFLEQPVNVVPGYQAQNTLKQPNPYGQYKPPLLYAENSPNLFNGNFGQILPQYRNTGNLGHFDQQNNFLALNSMNSYSQSNDMLSFNCMNNFNTMNPSHTLSNTVQNIPKLNSMHSANTFNSNSTSDTTHINNMSINELGNLSNMSNKSNISSMSNATNTSNHNYTNQFSQPAPQNYNDKASSLHHHHFMNQSGLNYLNWPYFLSMMNFSVLPFGQLEQDPVFNPAYTSLLNQQPMLDPYQAYIIPDSNEQIEQQKKQQQQQQQKQQPIRQNNSKAKTKAQSKQGKQQPSHHLNYANNPDELILPDMAFNHNGGGYNFSNFDFINHLNFPVTTSLNCKRRGTNAIEEYEELVKKTKINPLGVE